MQYSPERRELNLELRDYLYKNLYYNPVVQRPNRRAMRMLRTTFQALPRRIRREIGDRRAPPKPQDRPAPRRVRLPRRHDRPLRRARIQTGFRRNFKAEDDVKNL